MKTFARSALIVGAAAALLAACGGSQPSIGAPGTIPQSRVVVTHAERGGSWMLPEAKGRDLLYVTVPYLPALGVYVYTYPRLKPVGQLGATAVPEGECTDAAGHVFVVDSGNYVVLEYAHGGTSPMAMIYSPAMLPFSCSIDPTTGNLAVSGRGTNGKRHDVISIYAYKPHRGWRFPKLYGDSTMTSGAFCGYDNNGNLFVDGLTSSDRFELAALLKSGKTLATITLNQVIQLPAQVQWDGSHLAIGDAGVSPSVIYQFSISGSSGTEVGSTVLNGSKQIEGFLIQGGKLIGPDLSFTNAGVGFWPYPRGGARNRSIHIYNPFGVAISPRPVIRNR